MNAIDLTALFGRVVRTGITAHMIALAAAVLVASVDIEQGRRALWWMDAGMTYLLAAAWVMLADLALYRPGNDTPEPPVQVEEVPYLKPIPNLSDETEPGFYQFDDHRTPSIWGEWASVTTDAKLPALITALRLDDNISVRSMMGILDRAEVRRLQTFLEYRQWSYKYRGGQKLTAKGKQALDALPH